MVTLDVRANEQAVDQSSVRGEAEAKEMADRRALADARRKERAEERARAEAAEAAAEPAAESEPEPDPEPIGGVFNPGDKVSYTSKKGVPYTGKVLENRGKQLLVKKDKGGKALVPVLDKTLKSLGKSGGKLKHLRSHRKRRK